MYPTLRMMLLFITCWTIRRIEPIYGRTDSASLLIPKIMAMICYHKRLVNQVYEIWWNDNFLHPYIISLIVHDVPAWNASKYPLREMSSNKCLSLDTYVMLIQRYKNYNKAWLHIFSKNIHYNSFSRGRLYVELWRYFCLWAFWWPSCY